MNRLLHAAKGFVPTVILVVCTFTVLFALYGLWAYWKKPFNRSGKFEGQYEYSPTLWGRVASCTVPGATAGMFTGCAAGHGVAIYRLTKNNIPTT